MPPPKIDWEWVHPRNLAPLPQSIIDYFARKEKEKRQREPLADGEVIEEGRRDHTLTSMAGHMRRAGFDEGPIFEAISLVNRNQCEPPLDDDQVRKIAGSVARYAPDPWANVHITVRADPAGTHRNGEAGKNVLAQAGRIVRVPASQLRALADAEKWFLRGIIPAEMVSILSALPKAGKTTWLAHVLRGAEQGGTFCGQALRPARVVYVTEESETIWAGRRDKLGLRDHCEFVLRPFRNKPSPRDWSSFLADLTASLKERPAELVVIDTLAKLWPVQNENDASEVTAALMPLLEIAYGLRATLLLVHHLRKSDGLESTATRGSGGITAAVDCILELRRYKPGDRKDRRRVLHCDSRFDDRLDECVVQLSEDGTAYAACGDRRDTARDECYLTIRETLIGCEAGTRPPGMTLEQVVAVAWEEEPAPTKKTLLDALRYATEGGEVKRQGAGHKGSPFTYWVDGCS